MTKFKEFLSEEYIRLEPKKNWKEIVESFTKITEVIIQPNKKSLRLRGFVDKNQADMYIDYKNAETAKEVYEKVKAFVGI